MNTSRWENSTWCWFPNLESGHWNTFGFIMRYGIKITHLSNIDAFAFIIISLFQIQNTLCFYTTWKGKSSQFWNPPGKNLTFSKIELSWLLAVVFFFSPFPNFFSSRVMIRCKIERNQIVRLEIRWPVQTTPPSPPRIERKSRIYGERRWVEWGAGNEVNATWSTLLYFSPSSPIDSPSEILLWTLCRIFMGRRASSGDDSSGRNA